MKHNLRKLVRFHPNLSIPCLTDRQPLETGVRKHDVYRLPLRLPIERNRSFVGRKAHLQQIKDRLHCSGAEHSCAGSPLSDRVVILYGLGGMGKTQLALKYAAENAETYSAVLWINASNERNAHLGFRDTAQRYVDAVMDERDPEVRQTELRKLHLGRLVNADGEVSLDEAHLGEITKSVISFLERDDNDNWLLILDNVDDVQSFDITNFLPKSPTRKVILTSRLTATTRLGCAVEVDAIDEEDAVEILLNNSPLRSKSITGMLNYTLTMLQIQFLRSNRLRNLQKDIEDIRLLAAGS